MDKHQLTKDKHQSRTCSVNQNYFSTSFNFPTSAAKVTCIQNSGVFNHSVYDIFFFRQGGKNLNVSRSNAREIDGGPVATTTERIIVPGKNDKTHSTPKVETAADDQLRNRNSIFSGNNRVNNNIYNNKQLSTIFPTFATRFNFPEETATLPESTTSKVDVEKLEKELLDVLDRLAQSYTDSTDSQ